MLIRRTILLLIVLLHGCAEMAQKPQPEPVEPPAVEKPAIELPYQAESHSFSEGLTEELVFTILAGEVAVQRGDLPAAYSYYLQAAKDAEDSYGAEQAVRISVYLKDLKGAIAAVEQWIRLSPNHLPGRTLAVMLYAQEGQSDLAYEQLQALVKISNAQGEDGFMRAVTAISQIENRHMGLELIRRLAAEHEADQRAGYALVIAAVGAEEYDEAESEARRLVDTYPDREKMQALLSNILHSKGDDREALRILEAALGESPENRTLLTAYARLLMEVDELDLAYKQFKKIERLSKEDGDVLYTLGILALELERWSEGRAYLERAIAVGNHIDEATYYIAYSYEVQEDFEQALLWYSRVEGGDQRMEAQIKSATLMAKQGDVAGARERLRSLRQSTPQRAVELYMVEGEILRSRELHKQMMSLYNQALDDFPGNHELLYGRALNAAAIGRLDILETDLQAILVQDPQNADALNALGYTLADKTDRLQEALGYIQQALDLKPEAPAILDSMGWVQYRLGNHMQALRYLQHAMELMPDAEIASHLGEVLWVTGEKDEALKVWREALKRNPHSKSLLEAMRRFGQ